MSTWIYDPATHAIRNVDHGTWEIDLSKVKGSDDLLYWILQAAQHNFDMPALFEAFREAINWCFGKEEINGAAALKELFVEYPPEMGPVDWIAGKVGSA
ncbi:hypothetical protein [Chromohalobacter israelensis]|uniref:hypothetical protein n=1 Tax=Chromohalobacter israelensis TaxID=141390 RepID=UPI000FFEC819|nr:hypothetical protein [Chromohalobacter salexigens]RXE47302.1 hypothetical protein B4O83_04560 [Chromohalobacter salexigens]